jgi:anaerobic selenocysteine-containing dehydrogenase
MATPFRARSEILPLDIVPSVCPHDCPSTCALEVERLDARTIGRVRGARDNSYTAGIVCAKVARYAERQHHPERLSRPLRRTGDKGVGRDAYVPIGWDDALDVIADAFIRAAQRDGSEAVWPYYYAGTMGLVQRDGINRLRHAMRYSGQDPTICTRASDTGWIAGTGAKRGTDAREMAESDLIVVWGGNPVNTQVNVMTHIARARRARGARLVVIDTYRTGTAELADHFLAVRPGTDGALACAVMHLLFKEGHADRDYLARYTDAPEAFEAHLESRTPEWAAAITGLTVDEIVGFARLYGATKRSFIRVGYGFSRSRNGSAQLHAVSCLPAVTGAWRHRGGGALYGQGGPLYHLDKTLIEGLDRCDPAVRVLDMSRIGPVLTGDRRDLGAGPPVTAMLVQNTNPMVVAPDSLKVRAGLMRADLFVAVHEQFMTETAAMADIVLPATTFLEHDDIYTASGHTHLQLARRVVEPHAEARTNHFVVCELARRLGAAHPGFAMTERQLIEATLAASNLPPTKDFDGERWLDLALPFETAHFLDGFATPDRKFHFRPNWRTLGPYGDGMPEFADHVAMTDAATPDRPYRLVAAPSRSFLNSSFNNTPSSVAREGRPTARLHPDDLAELGAREGDRVRLGNGQASVVVHARAAEGQRRKTVIVEGVWPNAAFAEGIGINALTSADPGRPNGGAVFHDTAVWVRPT